MERTRQKPWAEARGEGGEKAEGEGGEGGPSEVVESCSLAASGPERPCPPPALAPPRCLPMPSAAVFVRRFVSGGDGGDSGARVRGREGGREACLRDVRTGVRAAGRGDANASGLFLCPIESARFQHSNAPGATLTAGEIRLPCRRPGIIADAGGAGWRRGGAVSIISVGHNRR